MSRPKSSLIYVAYHESGHAIAAHFQDIRFKYATIEPDKSNGSLGHVMFARCKARVDILRNGDELTPSKRAYLDSRIICCFAGGVAERKYRGRNNHVGASQDMHDAMDFALAISASDEEATAYLKWLHCRTDNLINRWWWVVEDVAQALLVNKVMTMAQVQQTIYEGSARRLPPLPPIVTQ